MRILFMGTSPFAVESLRALIAHGCDVSCVVTQPDKPKGRGYKMQPTPVREFAEENGLPVHTPDTLKDGALLPLLNECDPELIVVVAYGKILPQYVLDYPRFGCVNVHASLLPKYRGAAPINRVLIDGETETGVTTMYMDAGLDTGDMILRARTPIEDRDNFGSLHERLAIVGGELLCRTVDMIADGTAPRQPQIGESCYAAMIERETRKIDFSKTSAAIFNLVRGLSPMPGAVATCGGKSVKILSVEPIDGVWNVPCGTVIDPKRMIVKTGDGAVRLITVQPEGKKPMSGESFAAGNRAERFE